MVIKMLIDFHMHSDTSADSKQSIREIYDTAVEKGLHHICITNHMEHSEIRKGDYHQSMTDKEIQRCRSEIDELNKEGKVQVSFGVEIDYADEDEEDIRLFLSEHEFDFVLGSIHYCEGWNLGNPNNNEKMKDIPHRRVIDEYFLLLKNAIKSGLFDVMSHLDIYKRVLDDPGLDELKDEWDEVAELLLKHDIGFEINTSHTKLVEGSTYPGNEIIDYLVGKGIKKITTGSDAHRSEYVGHNISDVLDHLRRIGVTQVYRFEKRLPIPEDICDISHRNQ